MKSNKRLLYLLFIFITLFSVCLLSSCDDKKTCSHSYGEWETVLHPTCTENGRAESACKKCGEMGSKTLTAIGHKFVDYAYNGNETCTSVGTQTATCDRLGCNEKNTVAMPGIPKGHIYNHGICISCTSEAFLLTDEPFDASATDADNVKVKVYRAADGHVEIDVFGNGRMKDYVTDDDAPWVNDYKNNIVTVHIYDGISSVGDNAFSAFSNLTKVVIGKDVTDIGADSFPRKSAPSAVYVDDIASWVTLNFADRDTVPSLYMTERIYIKEEVRAADSTTSYEYRIIKNLKIPDGVEKINAYAFYACDELDTVRIRPSVKQIGNYAFYGCNKITDIYIYDIAAWCQIEFGENGANPLSYSRNFWLSTEEIGANGQTTTTDAEIKELVIPQGVEYIKPYAFDGAGNIHSVSFEGNITRIGRFAFANCTSLKKLNLPDSLTTIDEWAFANCKSLSKLVIPDSVTEIGNNAFKSAKNLASVVIGNGITVIEECVFSDATNLCKVVIGENVSEIKELAFYGCKKLVEIHNKSLLTITNDNSNGHIGKYAKHVYTDASQSRITVTDDGFVFYSDGDTPILIAIVTLGGEVSFPAGFDGKSYVISENAFEGRTHITSVIFSSGITKIEKDAFLDCTEIKNITISSLEDWLSVELASEYSNPMCYATNLYIGDGQMAVTSLTVPESITVIGSYAFTGATMLEEIKLHDLLTEIKKDAFYRCNALKLDKGIYTIDGWIIDVSATVTSITIKSDTTKGIANGAFDGVKLETASLPAKYIKFIDVQYLKTITVSEGIIESGALVGAKSLTTINISSKVSAIEAGAFDIATCKALKKENGVIYAQNWVVGLDAEHTSVYKIAYSTEGIADGAFDGAESASLVFPGTAEKWKNIKVSDAYKETVNSMNITFNYK